MVVLALLDVLRIDDLTRIKGIGPAINKQLSALGITSYDQIVKLDGDAIDDLQDKLEHEQDIRKQDWIAQAKKLIAEFSTNIA